MANRESRSPDRRGVATAVAVAGVAGAIIYPDAGAAVQLPDDRIPLSHCVVDVVDTRDDGELVLGPERCFGTLAGALAEIGVPIGPTERLSMRDVISQDLLASASAGLLATHYDGWNSTGASISVSGGDCAGGHTNLSSNWTNRVSSTYNFCPTVRFFDGFDKTGNSQVTAAGPSNLSTLNNGANSVQYAS